MNHIVPAAVSDTIRKAVEEQKQNEQQIGQLQQQIAQAVARRSELQGKINGILTGVAVVAGFDTTKDITLSEDFTTLTGTALDTPEEKVGSDEEKQ